MRALLEFSRKKFNTRKKDLKLIRDTIISSGFKLSKDLYQETIEGNKDLPENIFGILKNSISNSTVIIIEGTNVSMSTGFILSESLSKGKPILFLQKTQNDNSTKHRFVKEIEHKLLEYETYSNAKDLKKIVINFLETAPDIKTRFNLVMNNEQDNFVSAMSEKLGISKTEYILRLIEKELKQNN